MRKILLVIDSFGELVQLEQLLKKLGFDTLGMHTPHALQDQLLGFSPDILVLTGKGTRVQGLELSQKIKKRKGAPKIVMLFPQGYQPQSDELAGAQMDAVFETPLDPIRFLSGLCKLSGLDPLQYVDKFAKLQGFDLHEMGTGAKSGPVREASIYVEGGRNSDGSRKDRASTYKEIAAKVELPEPGFLAAEKIQAAIKEARKTAVPEQESVLDESRREFVRALFHKK